MVVQPVNEHARRRYVVFTSALETVRIALDEADAVIKTMSENGPERSEGWRVPTKKEVLAARSSVADLLDQLRAKSQEYETQLIANGWRV